MQASGLEEAVGVVRETERDLDLAPVGDADVLGLVEVPEHAQRGGEVRGAGGLTEGAEDADSIGDVQPGLAGRPHQLAAELEHLGGVNTVSLVRRLEFFERLALHRRAERIGDLARALRRVLLKLALDVVRLLDGEGLLLAVAETSMPQKSAIGMISRVSILLNFEYSYLIRWYCRVMDAR